MKVQEKFQNSTVVLIDIRLLLKLLNEINLKIPLTIRDVMSKDWG